MHRANWLIVCALSSVGILLATTEARAGLDACGNIDVHADALCKVVTQGGCTAQCTPLSFEAACSGKLEVKCNGTCNASADVSCSGSCNTDCSAKCQVNPGTYDCAGSCAASCDADCTGKCSASAGDGGAQADCQAQCKATCDGHCNVSCTGTPPSASCDTKCKASCEGSCSGKANIDCQLNCQSQGYAQCKTDLSGGCTAQCSKPEGAVFCDGNYVDSGNNLQNCIEALNAILHVKVDASASCSGNSCQAQAKAAATCAASPTSDYTPVNGAVLGAGLGLAALTFRRRRKTAQRDA